MQTLDTITETLVREAWGETMLRRAEGLMGQLRTPVRHGDTLEAEVLGRELYSVRLRIASSKAWASCTCSRGRNELCVHTAALALAWVRSPGRFVDALAGQEDGDSLEMISLDPPVTREPEEPPFWMKLSQEEFDALYRRGMADLLQGISIGDLRDVAEERGWKARGIRKDPVIEQVVEHLGDPDETARSIEKLNAEHRQVLCSLVLLGYPRRGWDDPLETLVDLWGKLRRHKRVETYTRHLCEVGLAIPGEAVDGETRDCVPRPLARLLPPILNADLGLWPLPTDTGGSSPDSIGDPRTQDIRMADPYRFIDEVLRVLLRLEETSPPLRTPQPRPVLTTEIPGLAEWGYDPEELLQARREGRLRRGHNILLTVPPPAPILPDDAIEKLVPLVGDEERLNFIIALLQAAQILQPGSPVTPWPPAKEAFLRRDPMRQRGLLARTYFSMAQWSELWRMLRDGAFPYRLRRDAGSAFFGMDDLNSKLAMLRWLLLRVLGSFPDDRWVMMEDLDRMMRVLWPRFEHSAWDDFQLPSYGPRPHLAESDGEAVLDDEAYGVWDRVQGRFLREMITGPLHWLGLADLAFDETRLTHARFHGLADLYWSRAEAPPASPHVSAVAEGGAEEDAFRAEGLMVTVRPSALGGRAHGVLNAIARLETTGPDQFNYRLDGEACLEAFEDGMTFSDIREAWEDHLPVPMPEAIVEQLTAWWDGYGRVRLYKDVTVIEFSDDYALAEMKAVTSLDDHLIAEVSPRLVVIPESSVDGLLEELREAGHTPQTARGVELEQEAWGGDPRNHRAARHLPLRGARPRPGETRSRRGDDGELLHREAHPGLADAPGRGGPDCVHPLASARRGDGDPPTPGDTAG